MVTVLPPAPPSAIEMFLSGLGRGSINAYNSQQIGSILQGIPPNDIQAQIRAIQVAPLDVETKQRAIQNLMMSGQYGLEQGKLGLGREKLDYQKQAFQSEQQQSQQQQEAKKQERTKMVQILRSLPKDISQQEAFQNLMNYGISFETAKEAAKVFKGDKTEAEKGLPKKFSAKKNIIDENFKTKQKQLLQNVEKKFDPIMGTMEYDFENKKGQKVLKQLNKNEKQYYKDQIKLFKEYNVKLTPGLERIDNPSNDLNQALESVKESVQQGIPLDDVTARSILQEAGDDIEKAMKIAKDRGYAVD